MALKARALKRKEIKALKAQGINLAQAGNADAQELVDTVLDMAFADKQDELDEMDYSECLELFKKVVALTFGTDEQEKN